jgi:hypothetical protein
MNCCASDSAEFYSTVSTIPPGHRVIMYFIETKASFEYLSVVYTAAVATELRGIKIYSFFYICFK